MRYKTLHDIANSVLLRKGYSVHFYLQVVKHAADCLRELQFDVIGNIRTKKLELNQYGAVELPCDYLDYVRIGTPNGASVRKSALIFGGNRLVNLDEKGNKVPYGGSNWSYGEDYGAWLYPDGLHLNPHRQSDGFMIVTERREVQFTNYREGGYIILDYITDGSEVDNATQVDPYAQACIEAYVFWQLKATNRMIGAGEASYEKQEYDRQYRILRARKSDINPANVRASMQRMYGRSA